MKSKKCPIHKKIWEEHSGMEIIEDFLTWKVMKTTEKEAR